MRSYRGKSSRRFYRSSRSAYRRDYHGLRLMIVIQRRWKATGRFHRWLPHTHPQSNRGCSLHSMQSHNRSMRTIKGTMRGVRRSRSFMDWWPLVQWRCWDEVALTHAAARRIDERREQYNRRIA
jgi:hypothetical protein